MSRAFVDAAPLWERNQPGLEKVYPAYIGTRRVYLVPVYLARTRTAQSAATHVVHVCMKAYSCSFTVSRRFTRRPSVTNASQCNCNTSQVSAPRFLLHRCMHFFCTVFCTVFFYCRRAFVAVDAKCK